MTAISFDRLNSAVLSRFALTVAYGAETFGAIEESDFVDDFDSQGYERFISADTAIITALALAEGDTVTIDSVDYKVLTMEADDEGMTRMKLEKV